jgi:hypothetical protein
MGFRFRRSVRLFPGVRVNFSGSGIGTSIGGTIELARGGSNPDVPSWLGPAYGEAVHSLAAEPDGSAAGKQQHRWADIQR